MQQCVIVKATLNPRSTSNDGNTNRHEVCDFRACRFVAEEATCSLGYYAYIAACHDLRNLFNRHAIEQFDLVRQLELCHQTDNCVFFRALPIDVELGVRYLLEDFGKRPYGNINSLVPVQCSGVDDQKSSISGRLSPTMENLRIRIVPKHRAVFCLC